MAPAELRRRFETLTLRERVLVLVALLVLLHQVWHFTWWQPHSDQVDGLNARLQSIGADLKLSQQEFHGLTTRFREDPNEAIEVNLATLERQLDELENAVSESARHLISPTGMAEMLEDLITREPALALVSLESTDTRPVSLLDAEDAVAPTRYRLFRHGFAIEFEGSYLATLRYLEALDESPWRFYWDRLDFRVQDYPVSRVRLELHSLSLSEGWIGV